MKVLIIKNYSTPQPWGQKTVDSISWSVRQHQPTAQVDVCNAVDGDCVPDSADYDLVILTGGTFNLIGTTPLPWVDSVLSLIRRVSSTDSGCKLLGFCWGHQAIHHALGGKLDSLDATRIAVENIQLTPPGKEWFGKESLALHKFHKRYVSTLASGFSPLAENNEISIAHSDRTLSFQAHPELNAEISQDLVAGDDGSYVKTAGKNTDAGLKDITSPHDGQEVWGQIMKWAVE